MLNSLFVPLTVQLRIHSFSFKEALFQRLNYDQINFSGEEMMFPLKKKIWMLEHTSRVPSRHPAQTVTKACLVRKKRQIKFQRKIDLPHESVYMVCQIFSSLCAPYCLIVRVVGKETNYKQSFDLVREID